MTTKETRMEKARSLIYLGIDRTGKRRLVIVKSMDWSKGSGVKWLHQNSS
jgi:hypothetical protein